MESSLYATCVLALITHQVFKRFETYSIPMHLLFLCAPLLFSFTILKHTMSLPWAAAVSSTTFFSTILVSISVYRLSPLHPLAQYPGPLSCRLSKFWMAYISVSGRQHLYIKSLHDRYGDIVRIGPNELSFRDISILHSMMGIGGLPKGSYLAGRALTVTDLPFVAIMDSAVHAERRKPWARAFSATALKEYAPMIANRASQLIRVLEKQCGEIIIGDFFNYFAYDFMSDMAYGGGSELLRDGDKDNVWHIIEKGLSSSTFFSHVPYLGVYCGHLPLFRPAVERLLSHSKELALKRIERGSKLKDIFHYLNNEDQPEKPPPLLRHLLDDGVIAIVAGSDTTSSALTSMVFCLLTHAPAYRRLQGEIDRFYPADEDPCDPKHHRDMHYLTAVMHVSPVVMPSARSRSLFYSNETIRLYPPAPSSTQRLVPHGSNGVMLGPYSVPAGTTVMLPPYTVQRDPRYFSPFPEDFWPERWLVAAGQLPLADALVNAPTGAVSAKNEACRAPPFAHDGAAFLPFSHGPENCVGKQLAMQEMRTVAAALLQKFELRLRPGWDVREFERGFMDFFVTTRPEVPVTLHARF
ncbi:hypothetical protein BN946_scf184844.g120 [Trametes cinnabarina]|uniref:High nitrogen upregulated cytochrome P450 monooxygenase 2 n=1 Tax=Pycnoporus cinnabarinus TaxID=5643 RepID=A0A060SA44_PYCCI|nr:hypothetical protein BN946_scf184844.g120 [Trametes cinnabarina]